MRQRPEDISPVGACRICKRRHDNIGHQLSRSHPIKWFCRECSPYIKEAAALTKKRFDLYESDSMLKGGQAAGEFLDSIGETDLAKLNEQQFVFFFAKFLSGYEDAMKKVFEGMVEK